MIILYIILISTIIKINKHLKDTTRTCNSHTHVLYGIGFQNAKTYHHLPPFVGPRRCRGRKPSSIATTWMILPGGPIDRSFRWSFWIWDDITQEYMGFHGFPTNSVYLYSILVGGLEHDFFIFPHIGDNHPNWLIFFRWGETTNQYIYINIYDRSVDNRSSGFHHFTHYRL